jgi:hypothetical protein
MSDLSKTPQKIITFSVVQHVWILQKLVQRKLYFRIVVKNYISGYIVKTYDILQVKNAFAKPVCITTRNAQALPSWRITQQDSKLHLKRLAVC